jgi:hypothetical protein
MVMPDKDVWIVGDQTIDWVVEPSEKYSSRSTDERLHVSVTPYWNTGGVFLLKKMINAALNEGATKPNRVLCAREPGNPGDITNGNLLNHSFAVLEKYESKHRISQFLGFRHAETITESDAHFPSPANYIPKVIVIDDANLGFRAHEDAGADNWIKLKSILDQKVEKPWVLLKMSHPVARGDFWKECIYPRLSNDKHWLKDRLILLTTAARMRDSGAEVSRDVSWARSVTDILAEIDTCKGMTDLKKCRCLVISFGPSGILLLKLTRSAANWSLVCHRESMEGAWISDHAKSGMMFGYGSVLCACLARTLCATKKQILDFEDRHLVSALKMGLLAMNQLHAEGFHVLEEGRFEFPAEIFENLNNGNFEDLAVVERRLEHPEHGYWTHSDIVSVVEEPISDLNSEDSHLLKLARQGTNEILQRIPAAHYGDLVAVDQEEIESLRTIHNLMDNYRGAGLRANPLAVAVFGSPGAGKGYTVKQLAKHWVDNNEMQTLEFNLSQFNSANELVGALHQVRDVALSGGIPLVLWDEFDVPLKGRPLGWLKYFLAPIQDGKFQQEDATHLIGPAVFVFAGGTCESFSEFSDQANDASPDSKALDFLSRLRGYINIPGINSPDPCMDPDSFLILRRALILNGIFKKREIARDRNDAFIVDDSVLHAFLAVPQYRHGVRSMEAIMQMSRLRKGERYERSSLPSEEQLNLHVNGRRFLDIMRKHGR